MKKYFRSIVLLTAICFLIVPDVFSKTIQNGPEQASLVELFTSEGCSSCPPADAWFSRLKQKPGLWKEFVPAGFHVDYWDYIGWKDKMASPRFSNRQRKYARAWGANTTYTPGLVLNGEEWRNWENGEIPRLNRLAGILSAETAENNQYRVIFKPAQEGSEGWTAHAALLGFGIDSRISSGENNGKKLKHDFTALDLQASEMKCAAGICEAEMVLNKPTDIPAQGYGLAVWVTRGDDLTPVQAAGDYL